MNETFKSHLLFSKRQRDGILLLVISIGVLILSVNFLEFSEESLLDINSPEIRNKLFEIDSIRAVEAKSREKKIHPFNPNFITDFKSYTLGMSPSEYDRLKEYRATNKWINSVQEFKQVTQVSDSLLALISPYFKFPDWIKDSRNKSNFNSAVNNRKSFSVKKDLNSVTAEELESVYGVGKVLSKRIIDLRTEIKGFSNDFQIYSVWGLNGETADMILEQFTVRNPKEIVKLDINVASASDIATIPGVSYDQAKRIWEFRTLKEKIMDLEELKNIEGMTEHKIKLIKLYLYVE